MANTENTNTETAEATTPQGDANTTEATESPKAAPNKDTPEAPDTSAEDTTQGKPAREAAKYRTRLREVEAERDTLTTTLETARDIILNTHLSNQKIGLKAGGMKQLGHDITGLLNDDLSINHDGLNTALQSIRASGFDYSTSGVVAKSGTGDTPPSSNLSWGNALKGG